MRESKKMTLFSRLKNSVERWPERPALSWADEDPINYEQLYSRVEEISLFLKKHGIIAKDRIAILSENCPNWGISYFAITSLGAIAVPILPEFHQNEIVHILRHSGAKAIFVSKRYYDKIDGQKLDNLQIRILIDNFSIIPPQTTKEKLLRLIDEGKTEFARLKRSALQFAGLKSNFIKEDDIAAIVYTSGTTGHSKGVKLSHKNIVSNALNTLQIQNVTENDKLLSILPLAHTYECTIGFLIPIFQGASIYYLKKPPSSSVLLPAMQKIKPTMMLTVPLIIEKIFNLKVLPSINANFFSRILYHIPAFRKLFHHIAGKKLMHNFGGKLHFFGIGGALLCSEVERFLREAKFPYSIGYGLTETSPLIAGSDVKHTLFRSTGYVIPGMEVKINDPDPETGLGEIMVKGISVMKGYYHDPEKTDEVFTKDGYFRTGDLGILEKNYLFIKGRLKNTIIGANGENIYPEEIEAVINENEIVMESIVYQQENKLIARLHLNYEVLDIEQKKHNYSETRMNKRIQNILEEIRSSVNHKLAKNSRITKIIEQPNPFEKTPTNKIKRYLYRV